MRRIFIISILILSCTLCACHRNIDDKHNEFEKITTTSPVDTTTEEIIEETESTTAEPTTEEPIPEGMNLLQAAMLNKIRIHCKDEKGNENTPVYLKELDSSWIVNQYHSFVVADMNHDGQNEVGLKYGDDGTYKHSGFTFLYVYNNVVYYSGNWGEVYDDGYLGWETKVQFYRFELVTSEHRLSEIVKVDYDLNGNITDGEEYVEYLDEFSSTSATRYELTQENIMKYVK